MTVTNINDYYVTNKRYNGVQVKFCYKPDHYHHFSRNSHDLGMSNDIYMYNMYLVQYVQIFNVFYLTYFAFVLGDQTECHVHCIVSIIFQIKFRD